MTTSCWHIWTNDLHNLHPPQLLSAPHAGWTARTSTSCWCSKHRCSSQNPLWSEDRADGRGQRLGELCHLWTRWPPAGGWCRLKCSSVSLCRPPSRLLFSSGSHLKWNEILVMQLPFQGAVMSSLVVSSSQLLLTTDFITTFSSLELMTSFCILLQSDVTKIINTHWL